MSCYLRFNCAVLKNFRKFGERERERERDGVKWPVFVLLLAVASSNVNKVKENVGGFQN